MEELYYDIFQQKTQHIGLNVIQAANWKYVVFSNIHFVILSPGELSHLQWIYCTSFQIFESMYL